MGSTTTKYILLGPATLRQSSSIGFILSRTTLSTTVYTTSTTDTTGLVRHCQDGYRPGRYASTGIDD